MNFKPSDKVVCLNSYDQTYLLPGMIILIGGFPVKDTVYVVREVIPDISTGAIGLGLVGIVCNRLAPYNVEYAWHSNNFRKLEEIQAENKAKQEEEAALKEAIELINLY